MGTSRVSSRTPGSPAVSVPRNPVPDRAAQPPAGPRAASVLAGTGAARGKRALPTGREGKTAPGGRDAFFFPKWIWNRDADDRPSEDSRTGQRTYTREQELSSRRSDSQRCGMAAAGKARGLPRGRGSGGAQPAPVLCPLTWRGLSHQPC